MPRKPGLMATAAHFLGLGAGLSSAPPDDEPEDKNAKKPAAADGDEEDGGEEGATGAGKGKKAKPPAEEGDDDEEDDEDMRAAALIADPAHRQQAVAAVLATSRTRHHARGQAAERHRCAAIFAHPNAAKNVEFAANLAFNTTLSGDEATRLMASVPAGGGLSSRMQTHQQPQLGPGGAPDKDGGKAIANAWDRALGKPAANQPAAAWDAALRRA